MNQAVVKKPNLFEYTDYREFLKDMYAHLKHHQRAFSFRYFSQKAGFRSPNIYKLVMEGKRNLTRVSLQKFAKALKLQGKENAFFTSLVLLNQSTSLEEKQEHAESILQHRAFQNIHPLSKEQYTYLTQWFMIPVREMLAIKTQKQDAQSLAEQFLPQVSTKQVEDALAALHRLGLIGKTKNGTWQQTNALLSTGDVVFSTAAQTYHHEMMTRAQDALALAPEMRDISSVTLALSTKSFAKLKTKLQQFRKELLGLAEAEKDADTIYQMNLQFFPLTQGFKT